MKDTANSFAPHWQPGKRPAPDDTEIRAVAVFTEARGTFVYSTVIEALAAVYDLTVQERHDLRNFLQAPSLRREEARADPGATH